MTEAYRGWFDPNTGKIFIDLGACYRFNYMKFLSREQNIDSFIEEFTNTLIHEDHHKILFKEVGPEACDALDQFQKITGLAI